VIHVNLLFRIPVPIIPPHHSGKRGRFQAANAALCIPGRKPGEAGAAFAPFFEKMLDKLTLCGYYIYIIRAK
jgi:hypothetical protein